MAAAIRVYDATGATPTYTNADNADGTAPKFGRDDNHVSTASLPIPTAAGTNFSWLKSLILRCNSATGAGTTIGSTTVRMTGALATGMAFWYYAVNTYTQNTGTTGTTIGNYPAAGGANGATPANPAGQTYVALTTTATAFGSGTVTSANNTNVSYFTVFVLAVDNSYTGGGGSAQTVGTIEFGYTES